NANEWYILVDDVTGGTGAGYNVSAGAFSSAFTGTPVLLGPFTHSGNGNAVITLTATDGGQGSENVDIVEALCGYPQGQAFCDCSLGSLDAPGAIMAQSAPGSFVAGGASGNTQYYALVDTLDGLIDSVNSTGLFTGLANGGYAVYAINAKDDITAGLDIDDPIQDLIDGANGAGPYDGLCYSICPKASFSVDCIILDETIRVRDAIACDDGNIPGVFSIIQAQAGVTYELLTMAGASLSPAVTVSNTGTTAANIELILPVAQVPNDTTTYQVKASVAGTMCELILNAQPDYIPTITPDLQLQGIINICEGNSYNLITQALWDGALTAEVFDWYDADPAGGATPLGSASAFRGRPRAGNLSVSPMVTTDYWVVGRNRIGCADTLMFTIIVDEVPTLNQTKDEIVCSGDMVALPFIITPGAANILWSNSNTNIGLGATGTGDISFTAGPNTSGAPMTGTVIAQVFNNGCPGIPDTFDITVNPAPNFAASKNDTVCSGIGANIDLTALNQNGMPGVTFTYGAPVLSPGLSGGSITEVVGFESFEGTAGSIGYATPNYYANTGDYFTRTNDGSVNPISSSVYSNIDGSFFWAAEDVDGNPPIAGALPRYLTLNAINITGKSSLRFDALFGGRSSNPKVDFDDAFYVEYRIDGGAWVKGLQFSSTSTGFNNPIALDADMNGLGEGAQLTPALAPFGFDITGTGNSLEVRVAVSMNSGDEEVAFDNIEISATSGSGLPRTTASADPIVDAFGNTSGMMQSATYKVVPVSAAGCEGDTIMVNLYVHPEPVVAVTNDTVCSLESAYMYLSETTGLQGVDYSWKSLILPLPDGGGNNVITYFGVNNTPTDMRNEYEVIATSPAGCVSKPDTAVLVIRAIQNTLSDTVIVACEDNAGSGSATVDLTQINSSIGTATIWLEDNGQFIANPTAYSGSGPVKGISPDNCGTTRKVTLQIESTPTMPVVDMLMVSCNGDPVTIEPDASGASEFFKESFEGQTGSYTANPNFISTNRSDYFTRTDGSTISSANYNNRDGSFFWAAEDIDNSGTYAPTGFVTLNQINIANRANLRFDGLFAAIAGSQFNRADLMEVEYSVDGAAWVTGLSFRSTNAGNSNVRIAEDTDMDGVGDGTLLDRTFRNFGFAIPGSGTTLDIRVRVFSDAGSEEVAFDDLRVSGTSTAPGSYTFYADAALTQPLASGVPSYTTGADTVWVTTANGSCESMSKRVIIEARTAASIIATGDTLICEGQDCQLGIAAGTTGFSDMRWTGPTGFTATGANASRTNLMPADAGWYILEATDNATGCTSTDSVLVSVQALGYPGIAIRDTICVLPTDPMFNLIDSMNAGPRPADRGGVWAGPSALQNGDLGTFDPATMSSGFYQYGVTKGRPCATCTKGHIYVKVIPAGPGLRLAAILEGPFAPTGGLMRDDLRRLNVIPQTEPYTSLGYTFTGGGGETVSAQVLSQTGPDAIVDWVVIELRDPTNNRVAVHSRAALMQRDGDIVDTDGRSTISFPTQFGAGTYHIVLIHRNHLGVMTAQPYALGANLDLTNGQVPMFGSGQQLKPISGKTVMMGGDGDSNGQIQNTDQIFHWMPQVGTSGYQSGDFNLNGQVQNTDRVYIWAPNSGRGSQVPK
ncbi:MAG: PKD-like domain-containing protein, partial [Bacteroidia bacterium]